MSNIKSQPALYGVLVDPHLPRQDRGVPAFFDGWYRHRSDAEGALKHFAAQSPGAIANLVVQVTPSHLKGVQHGQT